MKFLNDKEEQDFNSIFNNAKPYKHLVIDEFLEPQIAEGLLKDFPIFNPNTSLNEFGKPGPKCVINDIKSISHNYENFYEFINSENFLLHISKLTGIGNLLPDPQMYGGGTHENIEGAELDCHIDFNYQSSANYHRRLNVLLYLNKEWDESWGGAIELHKDPFGWKDHSDSFVTINCIFNRCVIFETSEVSWHGFRKIKLPSKKKDLSRKLISIYLYTKERPQEEIFPEHGTYYLPFAPKLTLPYDQEDLDEMKRIVVKRDNLLSASWQKERQLAYKVLELENYVNEIQKSILPPSIGNAFFIKNSIDGYFHDGWVAPIFSATFITTSKIGAIEINGWVPDDHDGIYELSINKILIKKEILSAGIFKFKINLDLAPRSENDLEIHSLSKILDDTDLRPKSFILTNIIFLID